MFKSGDRLPEPDSDGSSEIDLENFKKGVELSTNKLQQLVYNDKKYSSTIITFVHQAAKKMRRDEHKYAIVYLAEAEKILQYGANCGKLIDRRLIICVLHNQACCFQKISDKVTAVKYIQAILYNLKAHLRSLQGTPTASNIIQSVILKATSQCSQITFARKLQLAQYNLQFCSLNSQLKHRKEALEAGKTALELYKGFFSELKSQYRNIEEFDYPSVEDKNKITASFSKFRTFRDTFEPELCQTYIKIAQQVLKKWLANSKLSHNKTQLDSYYATYSIGNLVQMQPVDYQESESSGNLLVGKRITTELIHCSMGYFQVATEYRLLAEERYQLLAERKNSDQYKCSSIYHVLAIIFIGLYIPYDLLFMHQIVQSYKHHYKFDLIKDASNEPNDMELSILFPLEVSRDRKSTSSKKLVLSRKSKKSNGKGQKDEKVLSKRKKSRNSPVTQTLVKPMTSHSRKNEYLINNHRANNQVGGSKTRKMRLNSHQSKKSTSSNNDHNYYLETHKKIIRPESAVPKFVVRTGRTLSNSSSKLSKKEPLHKPSIDEYGATGSIAHRHDGNLKDLVSHRSSRNNSTDQHNYMMRTVASEKRIEKLLLTPKADKNQRRIKQELGLSRKTKQELRSSRKRKEELLSSGKSKGKGITGRAVKVKKTITNYYL